MIKVTKNQKEVFLALVEEGILYKHHVPKKLRKKKVRRRKIARDSRRKNR